MTQAGLSQSLPKGFQCDLAEKMVPYPFRYGLGPAHGGGEGRDYETWGRRSIPSQQIEGGRECMMGNNSFLNFPVI